MGDCYGGGCYTVDGKKVWLCVIENWRPRITPGDGEQASMDIPLERAVLARTSQRVVVNTIIGFQNMPQPVTRMMGVAGDS